MAVWLCLTMGSYVWYNLRFVQHQGRYLFPALVPVSMLLAGGLQEVLSRSRAWSAAGACLAGACASALATNPAGGFSGWATWLLAGAGMAFMVRRQLPDALDLPLRAVPYVALFALDWVSLFAFIVPHLS
jgi:hypothetical protein